MVLKNAYLAYFTFPVWTRTFWKITLFEKTLHDIEGQILFFDLDVVIIDNINELFEYSCQSKFISIKEWWGGDYGMFTKEGVTPFNASVMKFEVGTLEYVANNFYDKMTYL